MKKILVTAVLALVAVGCSHTTEPTGLFPSDHRQPAQVPDLTVQGRVGFSESKNSAGYTKDSDDADIFYTIQVDCNNDRLLSREDQGRIIKISDVAVTRSEKRKFANFKKRAERQNKDGNANPYLKITLSPNFAGNAVCDGLPIGKVYTASNARFSSAKK